MTTISDPSAMTPDDPRWLSWFMQQRRFDRLSRKAQTGASLITDFAAGIYEMGYPGQRRGNYELSDLVKYARSTGGGRFNSSGVYEWVGNDVPRITYDPVTLQPLGILIEEQRTNLLTYSEQFDNAIWVKQTTTIAPNSALAPDGTSSADKMVSDIGATLGVYQFPLGYSVNTDHTISVFAKAAGRITLQLSWNGNGTAEFNLSTGLKISGPATAGIQAIGNGWYRCWTVAQRSSTGQALTIRFGASEQTGGDGTSGIYIWGAQLEAGAFPTSYIPTTTAQVTRAADVASVNTLSPWYNASEGTLFVDWSSVAPKATGVEISDGTTTNRFILALNKPNESVIVVNGNIQTTALGTATTAAKVAIALRVNDVAVSINGAPALVDTLTAIPAVNVLNIGRRANGAEAANGHIKQLKYFPRRLSNSELQGITA